MRNILLCILAALFVLVCTQAGLAEVYSYKDENGVMVFSDTPPDEAQVSPEEVEVTTMPTYTPSKSSKPRRTSTYKAPKPDMDKDQEDEDLPSEEEIMDYMAGLERIRQEGEKLRIERDELREEATELSDKGRKLKRRTALRVHNRKVRELNESINSLNERIQRHEERLNNYMAENEELEKAAAKRRDQTP